MNHNFEVKATDKILIVSPHPDDDSIGCGGVMSLYGSQCDVWLLTDGEQSSRLSPDESNELANVRRGEFETVMNIVGVNFYKCFAIPESKIRENFDRVAAEDIQKYDIILVPNRWEIHKDHSDAYWLIKKMAKRQHAKALIYEYEVWTTIQNPNVRVDFSDISDKKSSLISCYASQIADLDYVNMILGLNKYRGCSHGCKFAEALYCERIDRKTKIKQRKKRLKSTLKFKY